VHACNGLCTLNGVAVSPNENACPSFTLKSSMAPPQGAKMYPGAMRFFPPHPRQTISSYPSHMPPATSSTQIGDGLPPSYAYPPGIAYRHGYPTPRYARGYSYFSSTMSRRGSAGFLFMSNARGGRGGRGRGGRGREKMGGFAAGLGGSCVCPSCGYSTPHVIGTPCYQQTCPKCGSRMTRGS
jgi:hypothetical protein